MTDEEIEKAIAVFTHDECFGTLYYKDKPISDWFKIFENCIDRLKAENEVLKMQSLRHDDDIRKETVKAVLQELKPHEFLDKLCEVAQRFGIEVDEI